jgi:hypothetical protein
MKEISPVQLLMKNFKIMMTLNEVKMITIKIYNYSHYIALSNSLEQDFVMSHEALYQNLWNDLHWTYSWPGP